jgi:hypothetical protein
MVEASMMEVKVVVMVQMLVVANLALRHDKNNFR